jgi:hypothetical protein
MAKRPGERARRGEPGKGKPRTRQLGTQRACFAHAAQQVAVLGNELKRRRAQYLPKI